MFSLNIYSLNGIRFQGEADALTVPSVTGELTILPNHIPLVTPLVSGSIKIRSSSKEETVSIERGGIVEVRPEKIVVLLI